MNDSKHLVTIFSDKLVNDLSHLSSMLNVSVFLLSIIVCTDLPLKIFFVNVDEKQHELYHKQ